MDIEIDSKGDKKRRGAMIVAPLASMVLIALLAALVLLSNQRALVRGTDGAFYVARKIVIAGDRLFCLRSAESHSTRKAALDSRDEGSKPAMARLVEVAFIEIIPETPSASDEAAGAVPMAYMGTYRINASGNPGYLTIGARNGALYGSVRFPEWGRGAVEPLKGLYIRGKFIGFTRSITTPAERERTGSHVYFTQVYTGEYRDNGRVIQGRYMVGGSPRMWHAEKTR
ncbi:MAG TPA: hypothetical protein PKO25_08785 [Spirochaetota bacterium]|jgi:hypothetical protein|nr:MAG: hypothetical protein BWY96_00738 [Spirochaetes bacterium ADurb.BinA120]HNU91955.1 hypothetical protein [Spirochaetota bacterium]HPI14545.1 hypothetical protein [Spirochaetota bacterium]HPO46113.1 hypothetical protein [Spirochaetota bacterium]HPV98505.1 hypothetical protein [Spirochaetota bacterium]